MHTPQKKLFFWLFLFAFLAAALVLRLTGIMPANIRDFGLITSTLGRIQFLFAVLPWLILSLYWEHAAKTAAPAKSSESSPSRGVHVFLTNAAILSEIIQIHAIPRFLPLNVFVLATGVTISLLGVALAIWARRILGKHWSGRITIKVDHQLIRTGPYKLIRHPIYTGILTLYTGTAITSGSCLALLGLLMALVAYARKIRLEEANLRIAFGESYESYCQESKALIPGLL
jgi:protein-S-isoprenylcysteine O-methyltransferase Ste14